MSLFELYINRLGRSFNFVFICLSLIGDASRANAYVDLKVSSLVLLFSPRAVPILSMTTAIVKFCLVGDIFLRLIKKYVYYEECLCQLGSGLTEPLIDLGLNFDPSYYLWLQAVVCVRQRPQPWLTVSNDGPNEVRVNLIKYLVKLVSVHNQK